MPRITLLDAFTTGQFANGDMLGAEDVSENKTKKLSGTQLKAYILGSRTIGGTADADITTNAGVQTLKNKRLDSPKINSANPTTVTSEDLDKLAAVTVSAGVINYLTGVHSNVQTQLNGKASQAEMAATPFAFAKSEVASFTGHVHVSYVELRDAAGLTTNYYIDPRVHASIWVSDGAGAWVPGGGTVKVNMQPSLQRLYSVQFGGLEVGKEYHVLITFFAREIPGA